MVITVEAGGVGGDLDFYLGPLYISQPRRRPPCITHRLSSIRSRFTFSSPRSLPKRLLRHRRRHPHLIRTGGITVAASPLATIPM